MISIKDKVIFGGVYSYSHHRFDDSVLQNDQIYHQAVPVLDKNDDVWMIDTYQIKRGPYKHIEGNSDRQDQYQSAVSNLVSGQEPKHGDWLIYDSREYYHKGCERIKNESMLSDYKLICNLKEYRRAERNEDPNDYNREDVVRGIKLYFECGYEWNRGPVGWTLIKKSAVKDRLIQYSNLLSVARKDVSQSVNYSYNSLSQLMNQRQKLIDSNQFIPVRLEQIYRNIQERISLIDKYNQALKDIDVNVPIEYTWNYETSCTTTLQAIHPDMENYLKTKCYCPHEVYDTSGIWYELFYPETICKVIYIDISRMTVIAKGYQSYYPSILHILVDDDKQIIEAIQRCDVTYNNIIMFLQDDFVGKSPETYQQIVFETELNELIDSIPEIKIS